MLMNWPNFISLMNHSVAELAKAAPKTVAGYRSLHAAHAAGGKLDARTRELIAIAVAVTTRCDACIANHVEKARELGVTREEIAEALGVAVAMNAGAALAYSARALDAYEGIGETSPA